MHRRSAIPVTALLPLAWAGPAAADVRLPSIFGDHMVVQQDATVPIWGWASPGEQVRVSASWGDSASGVADDRGRWRVTLRTPEAGPGAHRIEVAGANAITIRDVLAGEVWVCSGQSNMEWALPFVEGGAEAARAADRPRLRLFNVANTAALAPADDAPGAWAPCTPASVAGFSAVGYFFGAAIQDDLGVPVGLIEADWGGTAAEAWASAAALDPLGDFDDALAALRRATGDPADFAREHARAVEDWIAGVNAADPGLSGPLAWHSPDLDDTDWATAPVPGPWAGAAAGFDGLGWYRTSFDLPKPWTGADATLHLGPIDDCDMTWFNGSLVGRVMQPSEGNWQTPRAYTVPGTLLRAGRNTLAIRVLDAVGAGGLYGRPRQVFLRSSGGQTRGLAGDWKFRTTTAFADLAPRPPTPEELNGPWTPTTLFNGMIAPIAGYGIRGVVWYQGESNVGRAAQYRALFPALIGDWRARWGRGDFPFYFVQIAPFAYANDRGQAAELREAQAAALALPNTGMAVTMDIGNPLDIHPANKRDVGDRLARWALRQTYGRTGVACSGPVYAGMTVEGGAIRLAFDHAEGLRAAAGGEPTHFTIAGADRRFVPARAVIEGATVVVSAPEVPRPAAVRHAWGAADTPNLRNGAGLPAPSFRTDDWPGVDGGG